MSKNRVRMITNGKKPNRMCPVCNAQVDKVIMHRQLSYLCVKLSPISPQHWGSWDDAPARLSA